MSSVFRDVRTDGWCVRLDLREQVLSLNVSRSSWRRDDNLSPTPPNTGVVSAAELLWKAKAFDDGLIAAIDLAVQRGAGRIPSKAYFLRTLASHLQTAPDEAQTVVYSACQLGGLGESPESLRQAVDTAVGAFLADARKSKPLGAYTWSDALSAVYRQDRFLQTKLPLATSRPLAEALQRDDLHADYAALLMFSSRLTNPPDTPGVTSGHDKAALFPPSRSHEVTLVERLFQDRPIPAGFDLLTELIRCVRAGELSLKPTAESGWYDHLTWSLEPLLQPDAVPEAPRLDLGSRYRAHLDEMFKSALALGRESQVKQLSQGVPAGAKMIREVVLRLDSDLSVEPLAEVYRRRAECYSFVCGVLEEAFGPGTLRELHRLTPTGPVEVPLADELAAMRRLFAGAHKAVCDEIGHSAPGNAADLAFFRTWAKNRSQDTDLGRDARMMVPVFYDEQRRLTKVWVFLGWDQLPLEVRYKQRPEVVSCEREKANDGLERARVEFRSTVDQLATPTVAEVYVSRLMDRDEFRRHCDAHASRQSILANLE